MRLARYSVPGALTHVICRFVDRKWMLKNDVERRTYLELLARALRQSDWRLLAYALMSNHLHFAFIAGTQELQSWAKRVNAPFARWLNKRHQRLGPVFAHRPSEWVIRTDPAALIAYIHNNPVRAGVVRRAAESTWTSHRAYIGTAPIPRWLHVQEGLERCGFGGRTVDFNTWVDGMARRARDLPELAALRAAVRGRGSIELGTPLLSETCEVPLLARPGAMVRVSVSDVLDAVVAALGIARGEFCSRSAKPRAVEARRVAVHAARQLGNTLSDIAVHIGVSPQAASRHSDARLSAEQAAVVRAIVEQLRIELPVLARDARSREEES